MWSSLSKFGGEAGITSKMSQTNEPMATKPSSEKDSEEATSREYITMRKSASVLLDVVKQSPITIGTAMFAEEFISEYIRDLTGPTGNKADVEKAQILVNTMTDYVKANPRSYYKFIKLLEKEGPWTKHSIKTVKATYIGQMKLLICGRPGVGKSTLVNSFLKEKLPEIEGHFLKRKTVCVYEYHTTKHGISIALCDTPGLQDGTRDKEYLRILSLIYSKYDFTLFCINCNQSRFVPGDDNPDIIAMKKLTVTFGVELWKSTVIVLTLANVLKATIDDLYEDDDLHEDDEKYIKQLEKLREVIRVRLLEDIHLPKEVVDRIKIVPAGHYKKPSLPGIDNWQNNLLSELRASLSYLYL
ncbi:uncharacterized protein LOC135349078 [Halichondria panicea]|uniref:uncharacterized protein LOC135349078 n=1 Tax=Halichondria panicea TaxID=6063 RepID=UPI00312B6A72